MDSTLTAGDVKDFIVRGAESPRWNPETGQLEPPDPVSGAPETVYQLDAYGALKLLAHERRGGRLCGNRVWSTDGEIVVQRDTTRDPAQREVIATLGATAHALTVLHGGRRVEYSIWDPAGSGAPDRFFTIEYANSAWGSPAEIPGLTIWAGPERSRPRSAAGRDGAIDGRPVARDSRDRIPAAGACPPLYSGDWTGTISPYRTAGPP